MNERIQELIEQATTRQVVSGSDVFTTPPVYFNKEKFAELLIRECAKEIKASHKYGNPMAKTVVKDAANHVKRHFGVK
jgi:hypothetical protein